MINASILHVEKDRIYFGSPANSFIDTCHYSKVISPVVRITGPEPNFAEDRTLAIDYPKEVIAKMRTFEFNCENSCLGRIYLKEDTLILLYCGGPTLYFYKLKN